MWFLGWVGLVFLWVFFVFYHLIVSFLVSKIDYFRSLRIWLHFMIFFCSLLPLVPFTAIPDIFSLISHFHFGAFLQLSSDLWLPVPTSEQGSQAWVESSYPPAGLVRKAVSCLFRFEAFLARQLFCQGSSKCHISWPVTGGHAVPSAPCLVIAYGDFLSGSHTGQAGEGPVIRGADFPFPCLPFRSSAEFSPPFLSPIPVFGT